MFKKIDDALGRASGLAGLIDFWGSKSIGPDGKFQSIGQPGLAGSMVPFYGSGRAAIDDFQNSRYIWGAINTAAFVGDFFMVGALARAGYKLGLKLGSELPMLSKQALEALVRRLGTERAPAAAANLQWHHIWPRRFGYPPEWLWNLFPGRGQVLLPTGRGCIHTNITNLWNTLLPRSGYPYTEEQIAAALVKSLKQFPINGFPYK